MDYLTINAGEYAALSRLSVPSDIASIQLSRRDSLDNLWPGGFLIASIVPNTGETYRVAISRNGATVPWGSEGWEA